MRSEVRGSARRILGALAVGSFVIALEDDARAEEVAPSAAAPSTAAPSTAAPPSAEQRAAAAYDRAIDAYGRGDKESALRLMSEAYTLSPHVELVYDMAKLENELGHCRDALKHYRQYLHEAHGGVMADTAASATRTLQARCGDEQPAPRLDTMRIIGWSAIGAGVVAGATAAYFALAGQAAADDVQQILRADEQLGHSWDSGYQRQQEGQRDNTVATVCAVTAGTLIAGGTLILVLASPNKSGREQSVSVGGVRGGSLVTYTSHF
jgi:hypothetical protein